VSRLRIAGIVVVLLVNPAARVAVVEHVFLIKMSNCANTPVYRSQTGFRVQGVKGIHTALHGVADCTKITAMPSKGIPLGAPLEIRNVDIDNDMALLASAELDGLPADGLETAPDVPWSTLRSVKVVGHPFGIKAFETSLLVREPAIRPLQDHVPAEAQKGLNLRRSPALRINVLSVQGDILPGHSGAPILDARDRVVAVANGGLKDGTVGISWAIPFSSIRWERASDETRLQDLGRMNPEILFSLDARLRAGPDPSDIARDEFHEAVLQFVEAASDGFLHVANEPVPDSRYYFARIGLPVDFLTRCGIDLRRKAVCPANRVEDDREPHAQYADLLLKLSRSLQTWTVEEYRPEIGGDFVRKQDWTDPRNGQAVRLVLERDWREKSTNPQDRRSAGNRYALYRTVVYFFALGYRE
jgi:Trypsin-like peptidase domain